MAFVNGPGGRDRMDLEAAEGLAISALSFFAEDPERLGRFLSVTGLGPETLRTAAGEPGFLVSVLEYLLGDESLLLVFAETRRLRPTMIAAARHTLERAAGGP